MWNISVYMCTTVSNQRYVSCIETYTSNTDTQTDKKFDNASNRNEHEWKPEWKLSVVCQYHYNSIATVSLRAGDFFSEWIIQSLSHLAKAAIFGDITKSVTRDLAICQSQRWLWKSQIGYPVSITDEVNPWFFILFMGKYAITFNDCEKKLWC